MIFVDEHEPDNIVRLMKQSVPVVVSALNRAKMSDFMFSNFEGKTFQFSRKQASELVGDIDEAESQLADYYYNADCNFQLIEGIITPLPITGISITDHSPTRASVRDLGNRIYTYVVQPNGKIERGHSFSTISAAILYAWEHRLWMAGIPTIYTVNWVETARRLVTIYNNEQKPPEEHNTLQRIIKPKFSVRSEDKMSDAERQEYRLEKSLIFLSDAYKLGIGQKKAKAIAKEYVNLIDIAMADINELSTCEGIGRTIAARLLKALGRTL